MTYPTIEATVFEDGSAIAMARALGNAGVPITQATLASINYSVHDVADGEEIVAATSVDIASTVFDELQTGDPRWTLDILGYNFLHELPAGTFPAGARKCQLAYQATPQSGEAFWLAVFQPLVLQIYRT